METKISACDSHVAYSLRFSQYPQNNSSLTNSPDWSSWYHFCSCSESETNRSNHARCEAKLQLLRQIGNLPRHIIPFVFLSRCEHRQMLMQPTKANMRRTDKSGAIHMYLLSEILECTQAMETKVDDLRCTFVGSCPSTTRLNSRKQHRRIHETMYLMPSWAGSSHIDAL